MEPQWPCCKRKMTLEEVLMLENVRGGMTDFSHASKAIVHTCGGVVIIRNDTNRLGSLYIVPVSPGSYPLSEGCPGCGRAFSDTMIQEFAEGLNDQPAFVASHSDFTEDLVIVANAAGEPAVVICTSVRLNLREAKNSFTNK